MSKPKNIGIRAAGALLLLGVAVIHAVEAPDQIKEVAYLGALFVALAVGSVAVALVLVRGSWSWAWAAGVVLCGLTIVGYVISRTVGLPGADDDIGNWAEPMGVASLVVEGLMVAIGSGVLLARPRARRRRPAEVRTRTRVAHTAT
jgi:hypothetical protein